MIEHPNLRIGLTPLNTECELIEPELDEVRQFRSLVILIRDQDDLALKIEFPSFCTYRVRHEGYYLDTISALVDRGDSHWLYETQRSEFMIHFNDRNPQVNPDWDLKHFIIKMSSDIIDVISGDRPDVSKRTDNIRGWLRAGETESAAE